MTQPVQKINEAERLALGGRFTVPSDTHVDLSSKLHPDGWQVNAWRLWKLVGELHSPTTYIARVIARRINWHVTVGGTELEPDAALALIQRALGQSSLDETIRLLALNLQVAGDLWLVQTGVKFPVGASPDTPDWTWNVYSVVQAKLKEIIEAAQAGDRPYRRVWDPDPTNLDHADSAMSAVIESAEDLLTLSALSRAQSRSRIAQAGLMLVPEEQSFEGGDPFGTDLEQAMASAIRDVHSAAAVAPIKVEMAAEHIDKVRHVTFDRSFDEQVPGKMEQAIRRIALGLDIPPELLLGMGDTSHWNAWITQEETYRGEIAPLAEKIAGVLEYIVRAQLDVEAVIEPDPTELLARRSSVRDAIDGAMIGAVGLAYVRDAMGASDRDAATPEDIAIMRAAQGGSLDGGVGDDREPTVDETRAAPNNGEVPGA